MAFLATHSRMSWIREGLIMLPAYSADIELHFPLQSGHSIIFIINRMCWSIYSGIRWSI